MKTWWDYIPLLVILYVAPFFAGLLPTTERFGHYWGGGPVREYFINIVAARMPPDRAAVLISTFKESTIAEEILLYLPIALNISLITLFIGYLISFISMEINNYISTNVYKAKRQKAKGK